ncbi:cupin domain-containing protein [Phenylobacterium sp.]|uniref:cupin domain-containing protein n=1 Tax=Phenylobacterium sp. TaxID=1871053 RepID=UPI002ED9C427
MGLTQFGVNHLSLEPGSASSRPHWHEGEDEFVYVLAGSVTLRDENGEHELGAGDFAGFPAGAANGHHLLNTSAAVAELMIHRHAQGRRGEDPLPGPDRSRSFQRRQGRPRQPRVGFVLVRGRRHEASDCRHPDAGPGVGRKRPSCACRALREDHPLWHRRAA